MTTRLECRRAAPRHTLLVCLGLIAVLDGRRPVLAGDLQVVGTENSEVYHTRECSACKKINPKRKVAFASESAAQAAGRRKCKYCISLDQKGAGPSAPRPATRTDKSEDKPKRDRPAAPVVASRPSRVRIVEVRAGDTLRTDADELIRLVGLSCPDAKSELGGKAIELIEKRIKGKQVELLFDPIHSEREHRDSWRRQLAYVHTTGGQDVGEMLLEAGLAWSETQVATERRERYDDVEAEARDRQLGIWAPLTGAAGQRDVILRAADRTYHAPDCGHAEPGATWTHMTVNDAKAAGYHPCARYRERP